METHKNSALAIGAYPTFRYNASSGGGLAEIVGIELGRVHVRFDPEAVKIPALTWRTGKCVLPVTLQTICSFMLNKV